MARYRVRFPDDAAMTDLGNRDALERDDAGTFWNMYQFRCVKA